MDGDTLTIEPVYIPAFCESNIMNAIAHSEANQRQVASMYADCIRCPDAIKGIDWKSINAAIIARWPKGFERIKKMAWKEVETGKPATIK